MDKGWMKVKNAAKYVDMGERTVREWLKQGLPFAKLRSGTVLIKRQWLDDYLSTFKTNDNEAERIVKEVMDSF